MATEAIVRQDERGEALVALNEKLALLVKRGERIEVKDASGDLEAKQFEIECKSYFAAVDLYTDGEITDAKERLSSLTIAKKLLLVSIEEVYERVKTVRKAWEEAERKAAEKEGRKLDLNVKPGIPSVAGIQSRRNWKYSVKDVSKVKREYLMPDFAKIGQKVRELKDAAKAEKLIGGIEVWSE